MSSTDIIRIEISKFLQSHLKELHPEVPSVEDISCWLEKPPSSDMGDYALPCFRFAKIFRKPPPVIAQTIKEHLNQKKCDWIAHIDVAGGFLNLKIQQNKMADYIFKRIDDASFFKFPDATQHPRVMVEYSQPNTHKEFHVGHGRNVCLGDSLTRLLEYTGHKTLPVNYIGDEGTHVAKCLWQWDRSGEQPHGTLAEWYGQCYVQANQTLANASDADKEIHHKEISHVLHQIEQKSGKFYNMWQQSREHCMKDFLDIYSWLDVKFDHIFYESDVSEESQSIVDEYLEKGLFAESDGAIGRNLEEHKLGFVLVRKSDGTTPYLTKDLALARKKFADFQIDRSIYVVGLEQSYHFQQVFKTLELMGFPQAAQCHHLAYAHVTLPEGKMSSRKGNTFTFWQLIRLMEEQIEPLTRHQHHDWSEEERLETLHRLAVGAIKWGMLDGDPSKEIVFEPSRWTSLEGRSGVYLMYTYTRANSMLRKAADLNFQNIDSTHLNTQIEHDLLRDLYEFNTTVTVACASYKPSILAGHLYYMSKNFNRFYTQSPVLKCEKIETKLARLALVKNFTIILKQGLKLLGMTPPERM
ncbi:MAG: arginine--tRNA ligase [Oligoflexales bacterium]